VKVNSVPRTRNASRGSAADPSVPLREAASWSPGEGTVPYFMLRRQPQAIRHVVDVHPAIGILNLMQLHN
jgi:hypothetical protein